MLLVKIAIILVLSFLATVVEAAVTAGKSVVLDPPGVGVTYQIDAVNSSSSAVNAFVVDVVPGTIVNVSATIVSGGGTVSIDHLTNSLWWTGISIPGNGTATLIITGSVRSGAPAGLVVSNQATVQYDSDGNGTEDSAVATNVASFTVPSRVIHAAVQKTQLTPGPIVAGSGSGNLVYRITVTASASNERAAWFTIAETPLPATGFTIDSAVPSSGTWNAATREWFTDWIPPGQSATLDVTTTVGSDAPDQVSNTASFVSGAFDFITPAPSTITSAVCVPPAITTAPAPLYTINPGGSQFLSVSATGTALAYRWSYVLPVSGTEQTEATTPTVTVTPPYSRQYRITVSNACGERSAVTTVCFVPRVSQPEVELLPDGMQAVISVTIDPALSFRDWPTLQWFADSEPISGATTTVITVDARRSAKYWVRATNNCATYDSTTAAVANAIPTLSGIASIALAIALIAVALFARRV